MDSTKNYLSDLPIGIPVKQEADNDGNENRFSDMMVQIKDENIIEDIQATENVLQHPVRVKEEIAVTFDSTLAHTSTDNSDGLLQTKEKHIEDEHPQLIPKTEHDDVDTEVKEEIPTNDDSLVSFDYPNFDDSQSMDSNDIAVLGNVETCLQEDYIRSETEAGNDESLHFCAMTAQVDLQLVVKHIANGTFAENLCRVCLLPLQDLYENVFTKVCREDEEICIADVLKEICDVQILDNDHYNVCSKCFVSAWEAYKFYLKMKKNEEILHFYTDSLIYNLDSVEVPNESICISLPVISPSIPTVESDPHKICIEKDENLSNNRPIKIEIKTEKVSNKKLDMVVSKKPMPVVCKKEPEIGNKLEAVKVKKNVEDDDDDDLVIVMNENGQPSFFKMQSDGSLVEVEYDDRCRKAYRVITEELPKRRVHKKKRKPMTWKKCSLCPIEYRFVSKLRTHMLVAHGIMLYSCKICKALMETDDAYEFHMKTHTNEYQCDKCMVVFKKRDIMISHLAQHHRMEKRQNQKPSLNAFNNCIVCGKITKDEESLNEHMEEHNQKEYTCYYCGRMYKRETGFNNHIRKHEMLMMKRQKDANEKHPDQKEKPPQQWTCEVCGRVILSERALLWHRRLHTNERPYACKECGRGFVTPNRCKQHELCAHSAPTLRCPLCPALFHMRSMVSSHIKKVHLKAHKRRTRTVRQQDVHWHTKTVPVQELSVDIQNSILELQVANKGDDAEEGVCYLSY